MYTVPFMKLKLKLGGYHLISRGGGGQGYWDGPKYFFQYDPAHGYFFPAVRLTNYLFQPLLERLSKIANVLFIKAI